MRRIAPIIVLSLGFVLLAGFLAVRFKRDRDRLEHQLAERRQAVLQGWGAQWRALLLEKANNGALPGGYTLTFDRTGTKLKTAFFPTVPVARDWAPFRALKAEGKGEALRTYLTTMLESAPASSWDRALTLSAWDEAALGPLPKIPLSPYETTLIDKEAHAAYELIFAQFGEPHDYTLAKTRYDYDRVFFRVTETGDIQAFVPSVRLLSQDVLPAFLAAEGIVSGVIGKTPWETEFAAGGPVVAGVVAGEWAMALAAALAFLVGSGLLIRSTKAERVELARKVGFLNQVVHELRTPLTGLKLHVDLLARYGPRPESLAAVQDSARRLDHLFSDIAVLNRNEPASAKGVVAESELKELLAGLQAEFPQCAFVGGEPRRAVHGSRAGIEIILRNLIANGTSYGEQVTVSWRDGDGGKERTEVTVVDRGPGVDAASARAIFREFYRADEARVKRPGGLGLGLAVARRLAESMNARLTLDNPGQRGASFRLSLEVAS